MKLFSTEIIARVGLDNITRSAFVIAENPEDADKKVMDYIQKDRKLKSAKLVNVVIVEETAIV